MREDTGSKWRRCCVATLATLTPRMKRSAMGVPDLKKALIAKCENHTFRNQKLRRPDAPSVRCRTESAQTGVEQAARSLARERVFQHLGEPCDVRAAECQLAAAEADLERLLTDSRHQQQDRIEGNFSGGWSLERVGASSGTRGVNP